MNRRSFVGTMAASGIGMSVPQMTRSSGTIAQPLAVHIFSKHLQFLDYDKMAAMAAEIGFDGVELTVRPKGHVLPENVGRDLPLAVKAVRSQGLKASQVASDVNDLEVEHSRAVLDALADQGFEMYRMRYYRYPKQGDLLEPLLSFREKASVLSDYNQEAGLCAIYQNHAGTMFGSSMWEIRQMCEGLPPETIGCQYDIRHATVEGGKSWQKEIRLVLPLIKSIVAKDFLWKEVDGKWELTNVPLGEGMADFQTYFSILKEHNINVPAVLHLEYPIGGAEHGDRDLDESSKQLVYAAMRKDLAKVHEMWNAA